MGCLGLVLGTAAQLQQARLWPGSVYLLPLLVVALLAFASRRRLARQWAAAALAAAMGFSTAGWRAVDHSEHILPAVYEGRDLVVEGVIGSLPRQTLQGWQFDIRIDRVLGDPPTPRADRPAPLWARLSWREAGWGANVARERPDVVPGDRWRLPVRLQRPHGLANPQGFDAELLLWEQGVQATGHVRAGRDAAGPQRLGEAPWVAPIDRWRHGVRERLMAAVPEAREAGVLIALLAGDQASIASADWDLFRITGVAHLMSVSGLHITLFAWLAMGLVGAAWRVAGRMAPRLLHRVPRPVAADLGGWALATLYAAFAGWGLPAQRTVWMLGVVVLLRRQARAWPWPVVWLLALATVTALDPWALLQPGFWLSFVAVGVLFAQGDSGPTDAAADDRAARPVSTRVGLALRNLLVTQAVIGVALAPLTLMLFGQVSLVGLVANLLAIPWVTWVVTPLAMLGTLLPGLWAVGGWAVDGLMAWLQACAAWPWASLERPALPLALALLAVLGGVALALRLPWRLKAWGVLLLWPALVYEPPRPPVGHFEMLASDIGQGTAVLIRTRHHTLLYDTGPPWGASDAAQRVLIPRLRALGDAPERIVVSHADSDHASGSASLARAYSHADWLASFGVPAAPPGALRRCEAGQQWDWDGVHFEVLHPDAQDYGSRADDNAMSCVLRVDNGHHSVLLPGDIPAAVETRIATARPDLRATVLVAAHHGSHTSSGPVWLNVLQPRWVVMQAGHRNRYGHPARVVLERLDARGIPWTASPACGEARWHSATPDELRCHREQDRRYWQWQAPA